MLPPAVHADVEHALSKMTSAGNERIILTERG